MDAREQSFWEQAWEAAPRISGIVAAFGVVYAVIVFATGGIQPKSQSDIAGLQDRITHLEADKASIFATIESVKSNVNTRLDSMPRPKDFSDWEGHLHDLDGKVDALRQRASDDEYSIRDLVNRYTGSLPPSTPHR